MKPEDKQEAEMHLREIKRHISNLVFARSSLKRAEIGRHLAKSVWAIEDVFKRQD